MWYSPIGFAMPGALAVPRVPCLPRKVGERPGSPAPPIPRGLAAVNVAPALVIVRLAAY
jgi:hypothetical protein